MGGRARGAGCLEVRFEQSPGERRTVEVVVTRADRRDHLGAIDGTGDPRAARLRERLLAMPAEASFLVLDTEDQASGW